MSLTKQIGHLREIEYKSDATSSSFHEAGVISAQNFLHIERYIGSGVLEGGTPDLNVDGRITFDTPIYGLINGRRVVFDSTNIYTVTAIDTTCYIWLNVEEDFQESISLPDATEGLVLWATKVNSEGEIAEFRDVRNLIPETLNKFNELSWKNGFGLLADLPRIGYNIGDSIIAGVKLYVWNDQIEDNSYTSSPWQEWKTDVGASRVFKYFVIDGVRIAADSTADTLTFVEGRNIEFNVDEIDDDATTYVKITQALDMQDANSRQRYGIRRVKIVDATGDLTIKGNLFIHNEKLKIDEMFFGENTIERLLIMKGFDSTTSTALEPDNTSRIESLDIVKGTIDSTGIFSVLGDFDTTGNVTISGTLDGVIVQAHSSRHNYNGADEINIAGLRGFLKSKQIAIQLQGTPIEDIAPSEGNVLKYDEGADEYKLDRETTAVDFIEGMAIINSGFGRPELFDNLRNYLNERLSFDSTDVWQKIRIQDAFDDTTTAQFIGGTYDGKHVYFAKKSMPHVRFPSQQPFITKSWQMDFHISWYERLENFIGACFDGQYIYYCPYNNATPLLRFNTKFSTAEDGRSFRNFWFSVPDPQGDTTAWEISNFATFDGGGCVFDGRYVYYATRGSSESLYRLDTWQNWTDGTAWETADKVTVLGENGEFIGTVFDGRYVYFTPQDGTKIARFDTEQDWKYFRPGTGFSDATLWTAISTTMLTSKQNDKEDDYRCCGGTFDGRHVYFAPTSRNSDHIGDATQFSRFDTTKDWSDTNNWEHFDFDDIVGWQFGSSNKKYSFRGATYDGRYVYYSPFNAQFFVRFDTAKRFSDPTAWSIMNVVKASGEKTGGNFWFWGAIFDGEYVNFVPYNSPNMLRVKAFPSGGMFSRWGE